MAGTFDSGACWHRWQPNILGLILNVLGIGLFCWLIFTVAVYAMRFFAALSLAQAAINNGARHGHGFCRRSCRSPSLDKPRLPALHPHVFVRCSPLPLLFRQSSPAITSSTANRKLGRLHCFGATSLLGSAL